jgi:hypothetical protein
MEKRINIKIESYISNFKKEVCEQVKNTSFVDSKSQNDLLEFIYDFDRLSMSNDDFIKRKRIKNAIPTLNRCSAKRANGEQCTRRRKPECDFCGTHEKGRPHGLITNTSDIMPQSTNIEVIAREIMGIVYYIDQENNVYDTEDVMNNKPNPRIVAKAQQKSDGIYTIPSLGLM